MKFRVNFTLLCFYMSAFKFLHQCRFSRQKVCKIALQQDELLRNIFAVDMSVFLEDMFVFADETGADRRNLIDNMDIAFVVRLPKPVICW